MATDDFKTCSLCKAEKPLMLFGKTKAGRSSHCKACICARAKRYAEDGGEAFKAKKRAYDAERVGRLKDALRDQARTRYEATREKRLASAKEWVRSNPEKAQAIKQSYKHRRRTKERSGVPYGEFMAWKREQPKVCYWCGCDCSVHFVVDHYRPLSKDGKHELSNLVIACRRCNARKAAMDPERFEQVARNTVTPEMLQ